MNDHPKRTAASRSTTRRIVRRDLTRLRELTGATVRDLCAALGIQNHVRFYALIREAVAEEPVDRAMAIHMLYYFQHPQRWQPYVFDAKALRRKFGLTQAELGFLLGRQTISVQNWEQGKAMPDPAVVTLARLLDRLEPDSPEFHDLREAARQVWQADGKLPAPAPSTRRGRRRKPENSP